MVDIKETVKAMCKEVAGGRSAMAAALGMNIDQFNNSLYEKNKCRFFSHSDLELMEDLSGTCLLAEYQASRRGLMTFKRPALGEIDNVDLYSSQMRADAARGQVAQAKLDAEEDGIVDRQEFKHVGGKFMEYMRHSAIGFIAWSSLFGFQSDAIELINSRKVEGYQFAASSPRCE
ncbi:YmfL family putative regulatory protein [Erwinia sp. SLM-02]|uniref:YmfL family putative regulatory protein n=1 Tax=Erwinia sp. SLM-02 TaxID=3020057 RepID=UPI0030803286